MKHSLSLILVLALLAVAGMAQAAGDAAAGKAKSEQCVACHGARGEGVEAPKLAGMTERQLLHAMQDYKTGKREDTGMNALMSRMSDQDIENVAAYYATLK